MPTYSRGVQLGAARRRHEDAATLRENSRWNGAAYMAGYAVECSLTALICYLEHKGNFKDTAAFKSGLNGSRIHNLGAYVEHLPILRNAITNVPAIRSAWSIVVRHWILENLRYSQQLGEPVRTNEFMDAVNQLHNWALRAQGQ